MNLIPYYESLEKQHSDAVQIMRKEKAFFNFLENELPANLRKCFTYTVSSMAITCIRIFLYFEKETTATDMQNFISFGKYMKEKKFSFSKFFREDEGKFSYRISKEYKSLGLPTTYLLLFEEAPNIDGCEVKKKTIKKEVFYSDCSEKEKVF
jgi:hypothetical protein